MKFGVRECCDVVFRAKAPMKVGKKIFYKGEPVVKFDTLRTSTLEGAATTVYATGGKGSARLMSWDGEKTVTFTMEDALISPEGLAILTGAGLIEAETGKPIYVHTTTKVELDSDNFVVDEDGKITKLSIAFPENQRPVLPSSYKGDSENIQDKEAKYNDGADIYIIIMDESDSFVAEPFSTNTPSGNYGAIKVKADADGAYTVELESANTDAKFENLVGRKDLLAFVDYYVAHENNAMEIVITPDKFGGAFYIEGSTLFREYPSQIDMPAEIIIPNARVQSNFTFTLASTGDPSAFTFTMDAFPDYTRFDHTEKVFSRIQILTSGTASGEILTRDATASTRIENGGVIEKQDEEDSKAKFQAGN